MNQRPAPTPWSDLPPKWAGFTLIELLAVIVIMSLVASVLTVNLGSASEQAEFMRVVAQVRSIDALARLHARTSGEMVLLRLDEKDRGLQLVKATSQERLADFDPPRRITIKLQTDHPVNAIAIGEDGRSLDYEVRVLVEEQRQATLRVSGLTGFIQQENLP
jgi:prepilin-type N-terminal cleavage/methylation domain-containing protein